MASEEPVTIPALQQMKHEGKKIAGVVAWDYQIAQIAERAGADMLKLDAAAEFLDAVKALTRPASRFARYLPLLLALCFVPEAAVAHSYLQKSEPAQRAVMLAPPERVQLWFNERLEPAFSTLGVTDAAGAAVDKEDTQVAADNLKMLTVSLKPLSSGVYTVKFRVLSVDGHVVTNQFSFTVRGSR